MNRRRAALAATACTLVFAFGVAAPPAARAAKRALAPPLEGSVTEVYDGQTLQVTRTDGHAVDVRLAGVEAPLICQTWGPESRDALKDWVMGRLVVVHAAGAGDAKGKGPLPGTVTLEGENINRRLVEEGHAWSQRVKWDHGPYVKEERVAHALGRGLFSMPDAVRPADFRRNNRPCN